jgi:hypothetical protein
VVTLDSLSSEIGAAIQPAVPWQQGVNFAANATVFYSDGTDVGYYRALAAHTSSSDFDADEALGLWLLLADFTPPSVTGTVPVSSGGTGATTASGARTNLGLGTVATFNTLPVTNGGTGATSASAARTALGISIGSSVQAYSAQLDTLAAFNTNGLLTQTGAGTFAGRTITGGSFVTVTNGNGVSGNPAIDIPASVVVTAAETILANNNDTTLPTSAAVNGRVVTAEARDFAWSQTWQDVSGSRAGGTSYQNTSGRPIMVSVRGSTGTTRFIQVSVDNATWIDVGRISSSGTDEAHTFIVPNLHYYRVNNSFTIAAWSELR